MDLPTSFTDPPSEEPHRYFRNLCIEFRKKILHSKDPNELTATFEDFFNASVEMDWHHKPSGVYHKQAGDKAVNKVYEEFTRYIADLKKHKGNPQDLLDALEEVERMIRNFQVD